MALYAVNDKVLLSAALGGWEGYVSRVSGGPSGSPVYFVHPVRNGKDYRALDVPESQIDGGLDAPAFEVGATVSLSGKRGVIASIESGSVAVDIRHDVNRNYRPTVRHVVPIWRLGIDNPSL